MLNRVESTEYSWATTVVTHEYPITLPMDGIGQMSRLNARCLPIKQENTQTQTLYFHVFCQYSTRGHCQGHLKVKVKGFCPLHLAPTNIVIKIRWRITKQITDMKGFNFHTDGQGHKKTRIFQKLFFVIWTVKLKCCKNWTLTFQKSMFSSALLTCIYPFFCLNL